MKKAFLALVASVALAAIPAQAITISISPVSQTGTVGDLVSLDLIISGLTDGAAPSLSTFDLDLSFDPAVLSFAAATFGNQLDLLGLGNVSSVIPTSRNVNLFQLSLDNPDDLNTLQKDTFTLAAIDLRAVAVGDSSIGISINALGDADGTPLAADVLGGHLIVVPEPNSLRLFVVATLFVLLGRALGRSGIIRWSRDKSSPESKVRSRDGQERPHPSRL